MEMRGKGRDRTDGTEEGKGKGILVGAGSEQVHTLRVALGPGEEVEHWLIRVQD